MTLSLSNFGLQSWDFRAFGLSGFRAFGLSGLQGFPAFGLSDFGAFGLSGFELWSSCLSAQRFRSFTHTTFHLMKNSKTRPNLQAISFTPRTFGNAPEFQNLNLFLRILTPVTDKFICSNTKLSLRLSLYVLSPLDTDIM